MMGESSSSLTSNFVVRSFDVDAFGHLSPPRLAGYLQEAAGQSADSLGFGMADLNRRGQTWVLVRQQIEIDEAIVFGDDLCIETWPSGIDRWAALRDFRLFKKDREVGRALTSWFVLDLGTRRPVRPKTVLTPEFHEQTPHVMNRRTEPLPLLDASTEDRRFKVRYSDIDANRHVTNASYVAWALETIDERTWKDCRLASLDVQFMAECGLDADVHSRSSVQHDGHRLHCITREGDQKDLARVATTWKNK